MTVRAATTADAPALLRLFREVYGGHYPLALGRDLTETQRLLALPSTHWRVIRDAAGEIIASAVVLGDTTPRVGVLGGIAVHPDHGGKGLAHRVSAAACTAAFGGGSLDSAYSTVRLCSPHAQEVVLHQGFRPTGVLPGAAMLTRRESLGFFVRYAPHALTSRSAPSLLPAALWPLYRRALSSLDIADTRPPEITQEAPIPASNPIAVSLRRTCAHRYVATADHHSARLILDLNLTAGSARLYSVQARPGALPQIAPALYEQLAHLGVAYVEAAVPLYDAQEGHTAQEYLAAGMAPAAYYPAARPRAGRLHDLVLLAHGTPVEPDSVRPCPEIAAFLPVKETV
ncbi:GNAT family N-acetyltransferase [Corynebacterium sp. 22KM0430]|uniref:GNAT family N-acetyltransferase n=1 Tax=Corynebacterium sp. 22KM0430 TaxID=2989735 RepID=UPI0029CA61E7|nr:GNAT family N-acetyltransferase [Corynebacterium sp. 22KM0430]WPF66854.1 GNAT family N-acetyltransferase [Corynebacterium sp. 22KM0430]